MNNLDIILKSRDITLPTKFRLVKAVFSNSHVWMWELDYKESWMPKNWCFWTVVLEKTLESPLDCKEIQPVHLKGDQSWVFIGRTEAEAQTPVLWPPECEELTHWKRPWLWERLKAGGEGDDREWDSWMASPTWRTWVWASCGSWWWTAKPGMLQSMGSQRVGYNWTELNYRTFLVAQTVKNPLAIQETWVQSLGISGSGRSPREGNGYPLQYSTLEKSMDRGQEQRTSKPQWDTISHLSEWQSSKNKH